MSLHPAAARPLGLLLGVVADAVLADPRRGHPVAAYGRAVLALERRLYGDDRRRGTVFTACAVGSPVLLGVVAETVLRRRPSARALATGMATWAALGGTTLAREGEHMAELLDAGDLPAARDRLSHLCARDATGLDAVDLARASVESLAENTSDAVVAPLLWGAVAGVPGLLGYRAANTLDAMVGYTSPRYRRFGWASARLDDLLNLVPARVCGLVTVACAPVLADRDDRRGDQDDHRDDRDDHGGVVPGRAVDAWRTLCRYGSRHPSPNAGYPEAAAAGALGVRLGGTNSYQGRVEHRSELGDGRAVRVGDVRRAVRLTRMVGAVAAGVAVAGAALPWVRSVIGPGSAR